MCLPVHGLRFTMHYNAKCCPWLLKKKLLKMQATDHRKHIEVMRNN